MNFLKEYLLFNYIIYNHLLSIFITSIINIYIYNQYYYIATKLYEFKCKNLNINLHLSILSSVCRLK